MDKHKPRTPTAPLLLACAVLLAACIPATPVPPSADIPTLTPATPTVQLPSVLSPTPDPFRRMTAQQGLPEDAQINDLWIAPQGNLWVATDAGLYVGYPEQGGGFAHGYIEPLIQIIGLQEDPYTIWALGAEGATIHAFRGDHWAVYGSDEGWDPLPGGVSHGGPAVTADGTVWLATGNDDLRRFDPVTDTWSSLRATDLGFTPADPDYQGHYLTDAVVSPNGSLWVSDCIGMGEGFDGQGMRYFRDGVWTPIPVTEGQCVFDLERDADGRMWVGGTDAILVYDSAAGSWSEVAPPSWERRQYILHISFDPSGQPWVATLLCGGASCETVAYFVRQDDRWLPLLDAADYYWPAPGIIFDAGGSAWTCWYGSVYRQTGTGLALVGTLQTGSCEVSVDGDGTVWVAAFDGDDAGVWQVQP
jgi:hypothetical protein